MSPYIAQHTGRQVRLTAPSKQLKQYDSAIADCNRALELDPTYTKARKTKAKALGESGDWEEAVREYKAIQEANPSEAGIGKEIRNAELELKKSKRKDYYKILGVDKDAGEGEVKKAYRRLAIVHHPDKNPGDEAAAERFKDIGEAYETLSDSQYVPRAAPAALWCPSGDGFVGLTRASQEARALRQRRGPDRPVGDVRRRRRHGRRRRQHQPGDAVQHDGRCRRRRRLLVRRRSVRRRGHGWRQAEGRRRLPGWIPVLVGWGVRRLCCCFAFREGRLHRIVTGVGGSLLGRDPLRWLPVGAL